MAQLRRFIDDPGLSTPNVDPGLGGGAPPPTPVNPAVNGNLQLTVPPAPGGGGGGGDAGYSAGLGGRPVFDFGPVPQFKYDPFNAPTADSAQNEPGYQFRLKAGSDALERSAAAKGVLRTGGTLKDITEYGQNFGAQEYNNVFNRALSAYDRQYQGQKDAFAPRLADWQLRGQAETAGGLAQYNRAFQLYSFNNRGSGGGGGYTTPDPEPQFYNPFGGGG